MRFAENFKPSGGMSSVAHVGLTILMPLLLFVLVRMDFVLLAALTIILSKWRMFAVRMRYWPGHIRANAVDIMVGLSVVVFVAAASSGLWQLFWVFTYVLWLFFLKPSSSTFLVAWQAMVGQVVALTALFIAWGDAPSSVLVLMSWLICYLCARHFFTNFEEPHASLYAHFWGYFSASIVWITSHWLLVYAFGILAQPTLLLTVIGYSMAALYYLEHTERLSPLWQRQFVIMMVVIIAVVLTFSDWGDKAL